jgi:thiol-disulfide isomerase/thioredoxin
MLARLPSLAILCFVLLLASAGCNPQAVTPKKPIVALQTLDYDGIQKLIASHKGKVVVMDCWATYCEPCKKEFSKLVELHKKHGADKVACISLSFDYGGIGKIEEVQPGVLKFLEEQQATFDNVLCSEESDTLSKKMKLASIPAVYVYDRDGNMKRFEGEESYKEVPALVERYLKN